jgi:tripartite-type tricarboxylate transporter receptor subunit TctC
MRKRGMMRTVLGTAVAVLLLFAGAARAEYPDRPLRFVVPFPAGGVADALARLVGQRLGERLGQNVLVDNRPGAAGNIGMGAAVRLPADGYTLVLAPAGNLTVNQSLYKELNFDIGRDFAPLTMIGTVPNVLVVAKDVPATTLAELVALAKASPGALSFASPGIGTGAQLGGELLKVEAGIDLLHVPYSGIAPAVTDLVAGRVSLMFLAIASALPHIETGALRPLAVASLERAPALKDVPTVAEQGFPGFDVTSWYGIVLRAGVPPPIVARLYDETASILKDDAFRARLAALGVEPGGLPPDRFGTLIAAESRKWGDIIRRAGIKVE